MYLAIQIVLVIISILMALSILFHKGKGGGLSNLSGGGIQLNLSGSTVMGENLDHVAIVTVITWLFCIVLLLLFNTLGW